MSKDKKDVVFYFISKIIIGVVGLITVSLYSAKLTPDEYGEYSLISGLVCALISVLIGWIGSSALRYYIDYKDSNEEKTKFYSNIILYTLVMILVVLGIVLLFGLVSTKVKIYKYLIGIILFTISYSFMDVFEKVFRANQKTLIYTISLIVQTLLNVIFFYMIVNLNLGADSILLSTAFSKFIFIIISVIVLGILKHLKLNKFDKEFFKKFLKFGLPMVGVWGITWVLGYCDRYIIAIFGTDAEVGIYDMSYKIADNSINMIVSAFTLAIYPILIRIWKQDGKAKLELKIKELSKYYFIFVIPAVVGLSGIVSKLYLGIIDNKYSSGFLVIIIVAMGMFFNGLNNIVNKIWQLKEKTNMIFYIMLISVTINIVLNFAIIPKFGIEGAAITTLISYLATTLITCSLIRKDFNLYIDYVSLFKTLFCSGIMLLFILYFNKFVNGLLMLGVEIIIAVIIYGISNLVIRNISIKEVINLK